MTMTRFFLTAALALTGVSAATVPTDSQAQDMQKTPWAAQAMATPYGGVVIGNPQADHSLIEFISYTCPHCAHFVAEADAPIESEYIASGQLKVEIRPYLLNSVDYAASMLANCGGPAEYKANHMAILAAQPEVLAKYRAITPQRQQDWLSAGPVDGIAMILGDTGLDTVMQARGYSAEQITTCASDMVVFQQIGEGNRNAQQQYGVSATPSFALDGKLLPNIHAWQGVRAALVAAKTP